MEFSLKGNLACKLFLYYHWNYAICSAIGSYVTAQES